MIIWFIFFTSFDRLSDDWNQFLLILNVVCRKYSFEHKHSINTVIQHKHVL